MIINNIKVGSRLIQYNLKNRRLFSKVQQNLNNVPTRSNKKFKIFIALTAIPSASYYAYYKIALSDQEKRRVRINIASIFRAIRAFKIGFSIAADYKWNLFGLDEDSKEYDKAIKGCHLRAAQRMVIACIANGGLYVKLGQGLSTMNQILPEEYYMTLRKLQNEALRSELADVDELFLEEFNKKPLEMFEEFDYKPLAAASLAQVHKARGFGGEEYAVKLQYIDLQDRFQGDIFTIKCILKMIAFSFPSFSFSWVLDDLKGTLEKELDFINEGLNSERCFNELKHLKYVYVPKVFWEKTTKRILTMEFINGVKISDIEGIKNLGLDIRDIDVKLVNAFAEQIFHSGFVHADPHHANVFVRKNKSSKEAEIVLLDHGLYDFIQQEDRKNLCKLWKAIILKDEEEMKYFTKKLNVEEKNFLAFAAFLAMRPLHRPIHDKFIFNKKWNTMSEKEREKAIEDGIIRIPTPDEFKNMKQHEIEEIRVKAKPYIEEIKQSFLSTLRQMPKGLFFICSEMLIMLPLQLRTAKFQIKRKLDEDEVLNMRYQIRTNFHKIQAILRQVPLCLILVFRNLNTVRAIIHDHGNVVDRHTLMARSAIYGAYKDQLKLGLKQRLRAWFELRYFDFLLFYDRVMRFVGSIYLRYYLKNDKLIKEISNEVNKSLENI